MIEFKCLYCGLTSISPQCESFRLPDCEEEIRAVLSERCQACRVKE